MNQAHPHASASSPALVDEQHMFGNAEVELQTCTADPFDITVTEEVISQSTDADFVILDNFQDQEAEEHAIEKCKLFLSHFLDFITQLIFHFLPQVPVSSKFLIKTQ